MFKIGDKVEIGQAGITGEIVKHKHKELGLCRAIESSGQFFLLSDSLENNLKKVK